MYNDFNRLKGIFPIIYCFFNKNNSLDKKIISEQIKLINKIGSKFGVKKRNRRILPNDFQCMGRKLDGKQCTRGKRENSEYFLDFYLKILNCDNERIN